MRLIKIIGPFIERRLNLQRILVEQAVSLTGGPVVDHFFYDDPRNKATFLAIGFTKNACSYEELAKLYRSANGIEKSLLNIDFQVMLEHVLLSMKLWLAHCKVGKYDDYITLVNNVLYLFDCLLFVDNPPPNIKSSEDILALGSKMMISLAQVMVNEMERPKSKRMLTIQNNGEYLVARDDLAAMNYLFDDKSLEEVYRAFTVAQGKALPEPSLENFMPISTVYASPLKAIRHQPTKVQPAITIVEPAPPEKPTYAQATIKPVKPPAKPESAAPLTWLRNKNIPGYNDKNAYKAFGSKRKAPNRAGQYSQHEVDSPPDKPQAPSIPRTKQRRG